MTIAWVCINDQGDVDAASLVEWTERKTLIKWANDGRAPKLVEFGAAPIALPAPLPEGAVILQEFKP